MGQGDGSRLGLAGWEPTVERVKAVLPDATIVAEVIAFLQQGSEAVPDGNRYASPDLIVVEERSVVFHTEPTPRVVLYAKFSLGPLYAEGRNTGVSTGGTLKVMYDADGQWIDEFYTPGR